MFSWFRFTKHLFVFIRLQSWKHLFSVAILMVSHFLGDAVPRIIAIKLPHLSVDQTGLASLLISKDFDFSNKALFKY